MHTKSLLAPLSLVLLSQLSHAAVLYDARFASPPNIDGQSIVIDGTPHTPSRVTMGAVEMRSGFAGQPGNWAVFNAPGCSYDQIQFNLPTGLTKAYVSWDMFPSMLNNSESAFNVHLDSTGYGARSLSMHGGQNSIQLFNFGKSATLSSLSNQTKYRVLARVDAASDQLEISINGNPVYSGTFGSPDLTSVRMTLSPWKGGATQCNDSAAALSNVLIYEDPSDLETPPAQSIGVTFKLVPGYPTSVSANGGYLSYYRGIQNSGDVPLNLYTWITVDLPDGTGFPLRQSHSVSLQPGASMATVQNGLFIPKWFLAGDYKARMVVVNQVTGEQFNYDIPFTKRP
ncbi:RbmA family biofilm matrix protein [Pseudomonas sp.]|jgi:hypothetical protein|uniref:RbmA family biofilm matrix protein n=1 Tax=Pseudomonas sp. TaxID=306 RepID=UPI0039829A24